MSSCSKLTLRGQHDNMTDKSRLRDPVVFRDAKSDLISTDVNLVPKDWHQLCLPPICRFLQLRRSYFFFLLQAPHQRIFRLKCCCHPLSLFTTAFLSSSFRRSSFLNLILGTNVNANINVYIICLIAHHCSALVFDHRNCYNQ